MTTLASAVEDREKGEAPLSIGTSLALESLCGFGEFPSDDPPVKNYPELWVNLRTLFRNFYTAIDREFRKELGASDLVMGLVDDLHVLVSTLELKSVGRVKVVFYYCDFRSFEKEFPNAIWKKPKTALQVIEHELENKTIKLLLSDEYRPHEQDIRHFNVRFTGQTGNTLLLTHYPCDLLWRSHFAQLTLLESHTGHFKTRDQWYTKLTGGKRYERIPFNRLTIQVFGDGNLLFSSMNRKIKERLVELADQYRWTPLTTDERVRFTLNELYDPREKQFFLSLLKQ